ncbi:hypothetical protein LK996_16470 [Lysobacter sp. A6]|uniref:Cytochrome c domain-containing protein n=1 Tax=Noviluteimonas lactosilytica TaxID=2888523 RepID=A0ABS8JM17_9GAMM|nr:hypothetical protein [Lysobacter lactosilyticus]MCC8364666.1 hypothetical protein [Lysobacter lactosilyticus]
MTKALLSLLALSVAAVSVGINHPAPNRAMTRFAQPWMRRSSDANLPEVGSRRSRLVVSYCGQCHAPPPPTIHSEDEWRGLIVRMDMRAWTLQQPSVRVASNDELIEIARYYIAFSKSDANTGQPR